MAQAAHKTCEICMRASALHFCTQCEQVFCDDCKVSHLRSKISRNHTFMVGGCKDHNEDFIYLCEDCDQLICRVCVTKAHQKHYLVDIRDSNNKVKTEISKCLDSKVDNIRLSANIIEEKAKTYKTEVEATVKGIIEQGNLIKAMVEKKVNALIKVLRERERIELQSLSKANKDCPDLLEEASKHQHIYQDMIKQCDEVASFHKMKKIKSDVDNLKTVDITSLPSATYNRKNVIFSDVDQLFGNVTFQETEVTVKKTKLSAELHNQDKQPKQEMKKDQPPTTKLSSMAGDKLTKGNPAITDLGDPNRPMKIAEKYGGLYDNEWTDAMESSDDAMRTLFPAVDHQQFDEILVYHLHRLVMCCYRECLKLSTEQELTIRSAIINSMKLQIDEDGTDANNMPGYREIVNLRRQNAQQFANTLFQNKMISMTTITTDWDYIYKKEELIGELLETPFFEKCVHLCWYMVIQNPVMYMTEEIKPDTVYDSDVYKEFMQSGDKVKYVVWPALFLHEGGPLLYKGVVASYK